MNIQERLAFLLEGKKPEIKFIDDLLKYPLYVHCRTEEQAKLLLNWADKKGIKWHNGQKLNDDYYFHEYKEETCYNLSHGTLCELLYALDNNYKVFGFEEVYKGKL